MKNKVKNGFNNTLTSIPNIKLINTVLFSFNSCTIITVEVNIAVASATNTKY